MPDARRLLRPDVVGPWCLHVHAPLLRSFGLESEFAEESEEILTAILERLAEDLPSDGLISLQAMVVMLRRESIREWSVRREGQSCAAFECVSPERRDELHGHVLCELSVREGHVELDPIGWRNVARLARQEFPSERALLLMDMAYGIRAQDYAAHQREREVVGHASVPYPDLARDEPAHRRAMFDYLSWVAWMPDARQEEMLLALMHDLADD